MAGPSMDQFETYFKRADLDGDGRISGAEAVAFFQGSNLSKQVLAQVSFFLPVLFFFFFCLFLFSFSFLHHFFTPWVMLWLLWISTVTALPLVHQNSVGFVGFPCCLSSR